MGKNDKPVHETLVIPENLFIIGTMNDIDRSVESIDFALRRRFAWKEIEADSTKDSILGNDSHDFDDKVLEQLTDAMARLNKKIRETDGLGKAYELGAAYFANLELYKDTGKTTYGKDAFASLWNNHLEPILQEYLRGQDPDGNKLDEFKKEYDKGVGLKPKTENLTQPAE